MRYFRALLLMMMAISLFGYAALRADTETPKQRKFEITYTATLQVPEGAHKAALWLPLPKSDAYQDISNIQIHCDYPISFTTDAEYGNATLYVATNNAKAGAMTVEMSFQALRREHINRPSATLKTTLASDDGAEALMPRWLQPDKLVPINDRVRALAAEVTKGKTADLEKVRAIYDYAVNNLKYDKTGTGWGRGDIFFACDEKRGNCTDFHALVIGLCRAVGIPARFEIGLPLPTDKTEGQITGYHCWAEAYINGLGWLPMDASEANKNPQKREYFFGAHDENRVQFTIGRDLPLRPETHSDPLNYFIYPYGEIDEKPAPADKMDKKFSFKNL